MEIATKSSILCINGSPQGSAGNTALIVQAAQKQLSRHCAVDTHCAVETLELAHNRPFNDIVPMLERSTGFLFASGTYWDSWGSPLQRFFEEATATEGTALWLGKPAACIVSMHAVGGKGVLSRLQGVLNTFGAFIPPMSGMVCSLVNQVALEHEKSSRTEDLWNLEGDLEVLTHNLVEAVCGEKRWKSWPVERKNFAERWVR
jgi:multimeric flavodoxin WrbA